MSLGYHIIVPRMSKSEFIIFAQKHIPTPIEIYNRVLRKNRVWNDQREFVRSVCDLYGYIPRGDITLRFIDTDEGALCMQLASGQDAVLKQMVRRVVHDRLKAALAASRYKFWDIVV
jgi:hypothetical protein